MPRCDGSQGNWSCWGLGTLGDEKVISMGAVCPGCWQMAERKNGPVVVLEQGRKDPVGQCIWRWGPCACCEMTERKWWRGSRGRMWVPSSCLGHSWWWGEEDAIVFVSQGHWSLGMAWGQTIAEVGAQLGLSCLLSASMTSMLAS